MAYRGGATKMGKKAKAAMDSVKHPPFMKMFIPAQQAKPAPPLGPQLGKVCLSASYNFPFLAQHQHRELLQRFQRAYEAY